MLKSILLNGTPEQTCEDAEEFIQKSTRQLVIGLFRDTEDLTKIFVWIQERNKARNNTARTLLVTRVPINSKPFPIIERRPTGVSFEGHFGNDVVFITEIW